MRRRNAPFGLAAVIVVAGAMLASPAPASDGRTLNVEEVAVVEIAGATHLEFMERDGRHYALLGSRAGTAEAGGGLNLIDITDPTEPFVAARVECLSTGGNHDPKAVPVDLTIDGVHYDTILAIAFNDRVTCGIPGQAPSGVHFAGIRSSSLPGEPIVDLLGSPVVTPDGAPFNAWKGPAAHTIVNHPIHPVLYVGNQELATRTPTIEIISLEDWPPVVHQASYMPPRGTTVIAPHDITFNPEGTRAYAATFSLTAVLDVEGDKLFAPEVIGITKGGRLDHEAILHPNGRHLLIVDEFVATSAENVGACPGGGIHFVDLGPDGLFETAPVPVGAFYAPDLSTPGYELTDEGPVWHREIPCTAHEFDLPSHGRWMPIAWFGAGVRVLDLTSLVEGADAAGPAAVAVQEIGYFVPEGIIRFWSAKVHPGDDTYIVASDEKLGLRILQYTGELP